jgi:hypothetical protein
MIIYLNDANGKKIAFGTIRDKIFYKRVFMSEHLFKNLNAWGFDKETFDQFVTKCDEIRVLDEEHNMVYSCSPRHLLRNAEVRKYDNHGSQYFLALQHFHKEEKSLT